MPNQDLIKSQEISEEELALQEEEAKTFSGFLNKIINKLNQKEYEYCGKYLKMNFNCYGHLQKINLIQTGASLENLIEESLSMVSKINIIVDKVGETIMSNISKSLTQNLKNLLKLFNKNKVQDEIKLKILSEIFPSFHLKSRDPFNKIELSMNLSGNNFRIKILDKETTDIEYITAFATAYFKLTSLMYQNIKKLFEIIGNDGLSEEALKNFRLQNSNHQFQEYAMLVK